MICDSNGSVLLALAAQRSKDTHSCSAAQQRLTLVAQRDKDTHSVYTA